MCILIMVIVFRATFSNKHFKLTVWVLCPYTSLKQRSTGKRTVWNSEMSLTRHEPQDTLACLFSPPYLPSANWHMERNGGISIELVVSVPQTRSWQVWVIPLKPLKHTKAYSWLLSHTSWKYMHFLCLAPIADRLCPRTSMYANLCVDTHED